MELHIGDRARNFIENNIHPVYTPIMNQRPVSIRIDMMKKSIFFILFVVMLVFTSVPSESEEQPEITVLDEVQGNLLTRVGNVRKRAIDFECPAYFPSEWDAVEAQYASAANIPSSNQNEIEQASTFNTVADTYDSLFKRTIPLYAQAREDEIIYARDVLINTGFTRFFPEYLRNIDQIALAALDQYEAGDYYKAKDTAAEALNKYETMIIGAEIFSKRQEIVDRGFMKYDFDNFDKADDFAQVAINEYEAGNKASAMTAAKESLRYFNIVLVNGYAAE